MVNTIKNYFTGLCNGRFLDIGAFDGVKQSNSFELWKLGLSGWGERGIVYAEEV